jgi:glyoxylate/hydroxypyruvate reductase
MAPKVLITRALPSPGHELLQDAATKGLVELVEWTEDRGADREWLLSELGNGGVEGIVCMLGDKVSSAASRWGLARREGGKWTPRTRAGE